MLHTRLLDRFEQQLRSELDDVNSVLTAIGGEPGIEVFPLNESMLARAVQLATAHLYLQPFDQAILAAVLGRADELRAEGENDFCFCVTDAHLQNWSRDGKRKQPLTTIYDEALVWVYGDFEMTAPRRPENWPS